MTIKICVLLVLVLIFSSCQKGPKDFKIEDGICIQETNRQYVGGSTDTNMIYKVHKVVSNHDYIVSGWQKNKAWLAMGRKPHDYFNEKKLFTYKPIACPDVKDKRDDAGLDKRIKKLDFKF